MKKRRRGAISIGLALALTLPFGRGAWAGEASSTEEHRALMISAQVMRKEGKLLRSRDLLVSCSRDACAPGGAECDEIRAFCTKRLDDVTSEIPTVLVRVEDDRGMPVRPERLELDGLRIEPGVAVSVDPGPHLAKAAYAGRAGEVEVAARAGQANLSAVLRIDLRQTVDTRPIPLPVYVLGAAALVSGLVALGTGISTARSYQDLDGCRPYCDSSQRGGLRTVGYVADVSMLVALGSALGATIWFLARPTIREVRWLGADSASPALRGAP